MALSIEEIRQQLIEQKARQGALPSKSAPSQPVSPEPGLISAALAKAPPPSATANVNTVPPASWLLPAQPETPSSVAPQSATPPPVTTAPVLTPPSGRSSPPISGPTFVRFFKMCITAAILLTGSYFAVKTAYPFLKELSQPGSVKTANAKDAPTSVKILQQTRAVVAKNNANVDNLNAIINDPLGAAVPTAPAPALLPTPPAPPKPKPQVRLEPLTGLVLDELHVSGVHGGHNPRIMIDGLLVGLGGVVDSKRRLRFVSLDEVRRVIVFSNGVQTVEKFY